MTEKAQQWLNRVWQRKALKAETERKPASECAATAAEADFESILASDSDPRSQKTKMVPEMSPGYGGESADSLPYDNPGKRMNSD
jgi:hypothetical protein